MLAAMTSVPSAEYAAQLAACDPAAARPYRPDQAYEVGDVVHHLAYDDLGVVVAKEELPGGRRIGGRHHRFERVDHAGVDRPGADCVHAHAGARDLSGGGLGQPNHRVLGRDIGRHAG